MLLTPHDFPMRAIGPLIYGQMHSSPLLTTTDNELAGQVAAWLNDYARIKLEVAQHGPTLVTYPA